MTKRHFRFSVATGRGQSRQGWIDKVHAIEDYGYNAILMPDHTYTELTVLPALAVAAAVSTNLRIGSHVFCNDFHHPALLAKDAATLDLLSDGRFELGLGAGYLPADYTQTGVAFESPGTRVSRLGEALQVIRQVWSSEVVNFSGNYYTITDFPGSKRSIPITVGGGGKRLLSLAARQADSISISFRSTNFEPTAPEEIEEKIAWVRNAAGERFEQLELGYTLFRVQPQEAIEQQNLHMISGSQEQMIETLIERREKYGLSHVQVMEPFMRLFAPIVARLSGE